MDKKKIFKNNPIGYIIPQMEDNDVGLRNFERKFSATDFVSSLFGKNVVDKVSSPKSSIDNDVNSTYDPFRREKKQSDAELLAKYGTIYPEFSGIEEHDVPVIKKTEEVKVVEEPSLNINFDIKPNEYSQPSNYSQPNNYNESNNYTQQNNEQKRETSFSNVNFNQPREDYSQRETTTPPFLVNTNPVINNEVRQESYKEERKFEQPSYNHVEQPRTPEVKVEFKAKQRSAYKLPPLSLFAEPDRSKQENTDFLESNKAIINTTLREFNITGEVTSLTYGPTVSRYEITLAPGINVKKVLSIQDNMKMYLSAKTLRIQAPIPGKSTIGIEVPNRKPQMVHFIDLVKEKEFLDNKNPLRIALGKNIDNKTIYQDINKMPHGLIAGGTGSGKSVCINTLLISLLIKNTPADLKLILVDPKFVELADYNDIPHLITPVIDNAKMASKALKWAVDEMQRRFMTLKDASSRNIEEYNEYALNNGIDKMPFILIVIDELADLMQECGPDVEESIQRITQKARACGIHLIVATQRPTTDVVKGTIKANIPGRIAFRVSSAVDSTTILDHGGAESLLGNGDMLVKETEGAQRVQGAYLGGKDISAVTKYIKANNETEYTFSHEQLKTPDVKASGGEGDDNEILIAAALFFIQNETCSINLLMKQFNLGFNRAQKVVEQLEQYGIVSPKSGTLSREVLVSEAQVEEIFNK